MYGSDEVTAADTDAEVEVEAVQEAVEEVVQEAARRAGKRAAIKAAAEANPEYKVDDVESWESRNVRARLVLPCPACGLGHELKHCPYVFEGHRPDTKLPKGEERFKKRWETDAGFREGLSYIRDRFVRNIETENIISLRHWETIDAPASATGEKLHFEIPRSCASTAQILEAQVQGKSKRHTSWSKC